MGIALALLAAACGGKGEPDPVGSWRVGTVLGRYPAGTDPEAFALTPDGRTLYTANGGSGDVSVLDAVSLRLLATVPVSDRPWGVAVSPGAGNRR